MEWSGDMDEIDKDGGERIWERQGWEEQGYEWSGGKGVRVGR